VVRIPARKTHPIIRICCLALLQRAIRSCDRTLTLYARNPSTRQNRGLAWKGLGKMEKAELDRKLGQEIEPEFKVPK
jgi:hypothetical protein